MNIRTYLPDGVFVANLTPLNADLSVDYGALVAHCRWLLDNGADGLALLGTTGEANSFGLRERLILIEEVLKGGIPADRLMIGTGCCAFPDTVALTRYAVESGAGGVLMLPPFYYKGVSDEGLFRYFELVIRQVGHDRLKVYLYHFPKMSQVPFSTPLVRRLVDEFPEAVVGMKDSGGDWAHMEEVCRAIPGFRLYAGTEKYLADTLEIGGAGCISATTNATVRLASEVYERWKAGTDFREVQEQLTAVRQAMEVGNFTAVLKQLFARKRNDDKWLPMRPPIAPVGASVIDGLEERLEDLGFRW